MHRMNMHASDISFTGCCFAGVITLAEAILRNYGRTTPFCCGARLQRQANLQG